jgi:hypothetical protein
MDGFVENEIESSWGNNAALWSFVSSLNQEDLEGMRRRSEQRENERQRQGEVRASPAQNAEPDNRGPGPWRDGYRPYLGYGSPTGLPASAPSAPNSSGSAGTASGRSGLGNALRHIPILGGILGGVGDVVSGIGNTALGVVSLGQSGTLGRGVGQIASGTLSTVGNVWAMPNTAVGLVYGAVGLPFGAKPVWDSNDAILRFTNMPGWLMPSAMSLGHVQVYGLGTYRNADGSPALNRFGVPVVREETLHTRQAEVLGPLYLPLHILSMGGSLLTGGGTHDNNPLERGPERGVTPWPWK